MPCSGCLAIHGVNPNKKKKVKLINMNTLQVKKKGNELKQIEGMFPKNLSSDLSTHKFEAIIQLQDVINSSELDYRSRKNS